MRAIRNRLSALAALGLLAAAPTPVPAPIRPIPEVANPHPRTWPEPVELALTSGAQVQLLERPQVPLVRFEISLPWAGLSAPLPDQLAAAMMGQLLKAGTQHRSGAELDASLDRLGARWGLGVTSSRLWGEVEVVRGNESEALSLLAEAMLEPALARTEARRIQDRWVVWRDGLDLDIGRAHNRAVNHAWFPLGHPNRHRATSRDIKRLKPRQIAALHRRMVGQAQPRITVVGDISPEKVLPLLEAAFGHLDGSAAPDTMAPLPPRATGWLVDRPGFEVAQLTMVLPGPAMTDPDAPLADLLMALLASEFTSRIPMDLRETRGLAYGVSGHARSWRGDGRLRVDTEVDVNRAAEALVALEAHLDRVLDEGAAGFTPQELRAARNTLLVRSNRRMETVQSATETLGELAIMDRKLEDLRSEETRIENATAEELAEAASRWLQPAGRVWVLTGDRTRIEPALEAVNRVPDRIASASVLAGER